MNEIASYYYEEGKHEGIIEGRSLGLELLVKQEATKTDPIIINLPHNSNECDLKLRLISEINNIPLPPGYEKTRDNVLFARLYDDIQLLGRYVRYEQFDDAMKAAAAIAVKAAIFAAEERKG